MGRYLSIGIILSIVGIVFLFRYCSDKGIKKNQVVTKATVTEVNRLPKSGGSLSVKYYYFVEGSKFVDQQGFSCSTKKVNFISALIYRNPSISVVYEKSDPSNNRILLSRKMYTDFGVEISNSVELLLDSLDNLCAN